MDTVAVLMACHNRRETTRACLASLKVQALPPELRLELWLVDDASSDGTPDMVRGVWSGAHLVAGDGNLYWCGGMRMAWTHAARTDPAFFLWLNDDVILSRTAVGIMHDTWRRAADSGRSDTIVVGSCADPGSGAFAYGGQMRTGRHPGRLTPVEPGTAARECDTFDGNCVLVPRGAYVTVGMLGPFRHAMGDNDYGYRARAAGCRLEVAPGYVGTCKEGGSRPSRRTYAAWADLVGPRGLPPKDWAVFLRRHAGPEWPVYWLGTYVKWMACRAVRSLGVAAAPARSGGG